ncbi:MAG: tRNA(Ile)-lysidine synthase [Alphaproteobacteria bacterium MarineAlpha5_Bin8]|nr:MAG: tRNA(Ile)-lysidine synthase [Alphaproteobacteria bacterium MarineAlpha5_Bin7]PPR48401.1 MAG: tRNA(Ile)-lysidine synthase [Alphaproteobacteria bacterium MarineAlpha5_Bin8]PPR54398.1 MAG: tRNA(Ile)-lysidine synthase [Alphaproteobacteria bacterium MarineAlpha5_Bin6]
MSNLSNKEFESFFYKEINKNFIHENNPVISVAVSGGPDSIALVFLLKKWINKKRGTLVTLIVNHNIRNDSYQESRIVKNYLEKNNIKSFVLDVSKQKVGKGSMYQARENRFSKIVNYCKSNKIFYVFLGHHLEDNLETFVIRKASGSNIEGLNSMQYKSIYNGIQIIRPLINFSKKNILKYISCHELKFIDDPSNKDEKYSRVVVRNFIKKNTSIKSNILRDFNFIRDNYFEYIKMIYKIFILTNYKIQKKSLTFFSENFINLDEEIQIKIIQISYKYLNSKKAFLRYKKIIPLITKFNKFEKISMNLGGIEVKKNKKYIYFSC